MGRWVRSSPALGSGDLSHLTHHGHKVVGGMLYRALVGGYVEYRRNNVGAPVMLPTAKPVEAAKAGAPGAVEASGSAGASEVDTPQATPPDATAAAGQVQ
jgi:hypothetical protein